VNDKQLVSAEYDEGANRMPFLLTSRKFVGITSIIMNYSQKIKKEYKQEYKEEIFGGVVMAFTG